MGTLFEQPIRMKCKFDETDFGYEIKFIKNLMQQHEMDFQDVLNLLKFMAYERRTNVMIQDWDAKDEQLAGFGNLINELISTLESNKKINRW